MCNNVVCLLLLLETHLWCFPWKVFPYAGPQHCLLYDIDIGHLQQDLRPKVSHQAERFCLNNI